MENLNENIIACISPPGVGAVGLIRISGNKAISITNNHFKGKNLENQNSHTLWLFNRFK